MLLCLSIMLSPTGSKFGQGLFYSSRQFLRICHLHSLHAWRCCLLRPIHPDELVSPAVTIDCTSEGGDDWSKIKHIDNIIVEEMRRWEILVLLRSKIDEEVQRLMDGGPPPSLTAWCASRSPLMQTQGRWYPLVLLHCGAQTSYCLIF